MKTARVLSTTEFMNLSSAVRLGNYLEFLDKKYITVLNELLVITQPGHLQERYGREIEAIERDLLRAELVRERFVDVNV